MLSTPIASNSRDNLLRLYQKQRTVDYPLEERLSESGTLRKAWVDVLDSVERGEDIFVLWAASGRRCFNPVITPVNVPIPVSRHGHQCRTRGLASPPSLHLPSRRYRLLRIYCPILDATCPLRIVSVYPG